MKCPHCGAENENNAIFCKNCSTWILGSIYSDEAESALPEECDHDPQPPKKKKSWLLPAIAGTTALTLLVTVLLWPKPEPEPSLNSTSSPPPPWDRYRRIRSM